ncbi:MAG: polyprenyl synthetase family protein [Ruminiclostridium sp.]|nr:polyprenyl synthetase family protein [Ruminiclostridium sp.]
MSRNIEEYISMIEGRLPELFPADKLPQGTVIKASEYSLEAGGKRIRPVLTLAFCEMCGGSAENALDAACAAEYLHTYSLIHDDLPCMDDDDMRRGKPSCHKAFGEATALLAGDGLLTLAFGAAAGNKRVSPAAAVKCVSALAEAGGFTGIVGGQQLDKDMENGGFETAPLILPMYSMKTSALIKAACLCGVYCAQSPDEPRRAEAAAAYAENLGIAFQIVDDILDVTSTEEELGKPVGSDTEQGKNTFVSVYGLEIAEAEAADYTRRALAALESFDDSAFLKELTEKLLSRKK